MLTFTSMSEIRLPELTDIAYWSGGGTYARKLTTRARKSAKYGTRFSVDRRRRRRRGQGREEWCDLFFKILLLFFKILLFAINFLRFEAHLSCALFGGRF